MENERFARTERLIGSEGLARLRQARVLVVGLGAVGSYAVEALARAGVGYLRVVDFDEIRVSNINRQLSAMESTLGKLKVDAAKERIQDIHPSCEVEALPLFAHEETHDLILQAPLDMVIDAIDSLNPKVALLAEVMKRNLPVITCMGAALRRDPFSIRCAPLAEASYCGLAEKVRRRLRRRNVPLTMTCVFSVETRSKEMAGEEIEENFVDRGRQRHSLGSLPTIPGIFGLTAASLALEHLLKGPGVAPHMDP